MILTISGWFYSGYCTVALLLLYRTRAANPAEVILNQYMENEKHVNNIPRSYFWTTLSSTTIVTSLLAFAIFHLKGVGGWAAWR
jgi:hypothetical protein